MIRLPRITRIALAALAAGASIGLASGCGTSDPALDVAGARDTANRLAWCSHHVDRPCPVDVRP